jgi:lysophospholipase L1-like esterase
MLTEKNRVNLGMNRLRICRKLYCLTALVLFACATQDAPAQGRSVPWIGTWAVSPIRDDSGKSFSKQTLRQVVHTSVPGHSARLHVSNEFGTHALTIEDVHIAQRGTGSSIVAETNRQVQFGGLPSITIEPGLAAVSDPVAFEVPRLADVVISIYFPGTTGPATFHPAGLQTNYVPDGDLCGNRSLSHAMTTQSYYFLTNLDIQDQGTHGSVLALGASITDGYASTTDSNRRWPNDLAKRLARVGLSIGVLNQGISGNRLLVQGAGDSAENRFDRDVLGQPGIRWVIFSDDPINDLGSTKPPPTGDELIAGLEHLIARAHERHIKFLCSTLTPYKGAGYWAETGEMARENINAFIRGKTSGCDAVIDQDEATHDPYHPSQFLPAYDSGDHLHPNEAGLQAIADAVNLLLFSQPLQKDLNEGSPPSVHQKAEVSRE